MVLPNYSMGKSEFYQSYIDIHSCCIRKCLCLPKSMFNIGNCLCHMLTFIYGIWYAVCSVLYAFCPDPFMIYPFLLCSVSEGIYVVSKNPFVCLNSFITWAKIALSLSIFVASSLLCCICIYAQDYVALAKLYVALANSPFDLYWFIFRHDFSLGSNVH